jgi:hypothetical protein
MRISFIFKLILYFPGTVLHELAHYAAAVLFGKAEGFTVIPRQEGNRYVLGSVISRTRYKLLSSLIALAPLVWWLILLLILSHNHIIGTNRGLPVVYFGVVGKKIRTFTYIDILFLWLFLQMLWAGRLSVRDIKNVFTGLFSLSGLVLIAAVIATFSFLTLF